MNENQLIDIFSTIAHELTTSNLSGNPLKLERDLYRSSEDVTITCTVVTRKVGLWEVVVRRPIDIDFGSNETEVEHGTSLAVAELLRRGVRLKPILEIIQFLIPVEKLEAIVKDLQRMGHIDSKLESLYPYVVRPIN